MTLFATTRVTTFDPATGRWLGVCPGPLPDGRCSMWPGDGVACAGRRIVAEMAGDRRRIRLVVPDGLDRCPLAPLSPR